METIEGRSIILSS